jgi:hypothetical protein
MQAGQDRDRRTGIHPEDERWRKVPAEIHLAVRDHIGHSARFGSIGPAYMCLCFVYVADIGKALGAQQFPNKLRGDAGSQVFFETDRADFRWRLRRERLTPGAKPAEARGAGERGIGREPAATLRNYVADTPARSNFSYEKRRRGIPAAFSNHAWA